MEAKWRLEEPTNDMDAIPSYAAGTPERNALIKEFEKINSQTEELPLVINGEKIKTGETFDVTCPHDHQRVIARGHLASQSELEKAVDGALAAQQKWASLDGYQRASVFNRAADMLAGPRRAEHIASIMVNLSKTPFEAEIDLIELIDFWRFNAYYMQFLYDQQPNQYRGEVNRFDWRPLEGFVLAISPFNFYAIGGNLPTAPAMVGNVSLWKPSLEVAFSNYKIMELLIEAGLPPGVIQYVPFDVKHSEYLFGRRELAGLHFTGSYSTFTHLWGEMGKNVRNYDAFPRIVGEAGGKDFILVHPSATPDMIAPNVIRGAFEYQGQKCSAASRLYVPESLWPGVKTKILDEMPKLKVGSVEEFDTFVGALITEKAYRKVTSYIDHAKEDSSEYEVLYGGEYDESKGWFVTPTLIKTTNPEAKLICEEIFGPVMTVYVYPDAQYKETIKLVDKATPYALTGAIFAQDRSVIEDAEKSLRFSAGNFYINDKPTGAIVGRQPFGGARHSGTNDKAGSWLNLARWLSPRTIKETLVPPTDWRRPYMD